MNARRAAGRLAGAAAVLAAGLTTSLVAGPSLAATATTWSVTPGGKYTGAAGKFTLSDSKTVAIFTCKSAAIGGTLASGHKLGAKLGLLKSLDPRNCTSALGSASVFGLGQLPWSLTGVSYHAGTGVTNGTITGAFLSVEGSSCSANIGGGKPGTAGTVKTTYSNKTHLLKLAGGDLHFWDVSGCTGLIANGDPAALTATFTISPAQKITSP